MATTAKNKDFEERFVVKSTIETILKHIKWLEKKKKKYFLKSEVKLINELKKSIEEYKNGYMERK